MKKLLALLLAAVMCFSFVACGGGETLNTDDNSTQEQQAQNDSNEPESTGTESTGAENTEPENTEPEETTNPTESLAETRKAELIEILCGGKWVVASGPDDYASELCFYNDGTMKYIDNAGEEHSGYSWSFTQYVINGEIEGKPGAMPAEQQTRIEYSSEQGQYWFNCDGLTIMIVGLSVDGEYVIHYFGTAYEKVAE